MCMPADLKAYEAAEQAILAKTKIVSRSCSQVRRF